MRKNASCPSRDSAAGSPLVQQARSAYAAHNTLSALLDAQVIEIYDLTPPEVKALAACLLGEELGAAQAMAAAEGLDTEMFVYAVKSLMTKGLLAVVNKTLDFSPAERKLRVEAPDEVPAIEFEQPVRRVVPRPLRETVLRIATEAASPAAGLAGVYSFVFGKSVAKHEWAMLGKIAKALGVREAALFLLEHATYQSETPLNDLLPRAMARAKEWRPEDAPDPAHQQAERQQANDSGWRLRMQKWQRMGGEIHAVGAVNFLVEHGRISPEQADADRRQIRLDFERWRREGQPTLTDSRQ